MKTTIVYSSNENYALLTAHSIYSLITHNPWREKYKIVIFSNKIKHENQEVITKLLSENNVEHQIIELGDSLEFKAKEHDLSAIAGNYSTYLRLFFNQFYPDTKRALFIDSDTLILNSIEELLDFDLEGKSVAGIIDIGVHRKKGNYEDTDILSKTKNYFNAGVLLIDFELWRNQNLDKKVLNLMNENSNRIWRNQEQSILNLLLKDSFTPFHVKFNFYSILHIFKFKTLTKKFNINDYICEKEYNDAVKNPTIVHYVAPYYFRPWYKKNVSPYSQIYRDSLFQSNLKLNLNFQNPNHSKKIYQWFDRLNYILLKKKWYRFYFLFQSIASGNFKRWMIGIFGVR